MFFSPVLFWIMGFRPAALDGKEQGIFAKSAGYGYVERDGRKESVERALWYTQIL